MPDFSTIADGGGKPFWIKVGEEMANQIRVQTKAGKDVKGRKFKGYTTAYKAAKKARKFERQSSVSDRPDLTLTDDMLQDLQVVKATQNGVTIGFPSEAGKVHGNADHGRHLSTARTPIPAKAAKELKQRLDVKIKSNLNKVSGRTRVRIGK